MTLYSRLCKRKDEALRIFDEMSETELSDLEDISDDPGYDFDQDSVYLIQRQVFPQTKAETEMNQA